MKTETRNNGHGRTGRTALDGLVSFGYELSPFPFMNFNLFKLKEFADDNFKFYENGRKLYKRVENTVEKGEIARYEQFLIFPQCFQKICTADT